MPPLEISVRSLKSARPSWMQMQFDCQQAEAGAMDVLVLLHIFLSCTFPSAAMCLAALELQIQTLG